MNCKIMHLEQTVAALSAFGECTLLSPQFLPRDLWLEETRTGARMASEEEMQPEIEAKAIETEEIERRINNLQNFYYF